MRNKGHKQIRGREANGTAGGGDEGMGAKEEKKWRRKEQRQR